MKVFYWNDIKSDIDSGRLISFFEKGCGISIGSFDGLHQGHRLLLSTLTEKCRTLDILSGVISFTRPLPSFKHSKDYQGDLTTLNQRLKLFEEAGLDFAIIVEFNEDFASLKGVEFFQLLIDSCNMKYIAEGVDFRCGYKGSTDISAIKYFADNHQITYDFVEPVYYRPGTDEEERISSSYIRNMILKRFLTTAEELLVRPFSLELKVTNTDLVFERKDILQAVPPCGAYQCKADGKEGRLEVTDSVLKLEFASKTPSPALNEVIEVVL